MKPIGLASHMASIGLAIAIVMLFVRPTFSDIGDLQTEVQEYSLERERVTQTNQVLAARVSDLESIAINDRSRLTTYIPTLLDEVAVLRDIEVITRIAGVEYTTIEYNGELTDDSEEARLTQTADSPVAQEFAISVVGSYGRLKDFFSMLEQNEYPLQIYTLNISSLDGGFLLADATVVTYITSSALDQE